VFVVSGSHLPRRLASASAGEMSQATSAASLLTTLEQILGHIYTQVNPSVVHLRIVQRPETLSSAGSDSPGIPLFEGPGPQGLQYRQDLGSGFIWDTQGHIVTNNHVVEGADRIAVTFSDGATVPGAVVGADLDSDLAVVKVDVPAARLQPVQLADSTRLTVGQIAIVIGNPFGLQSTMTVGFISALGRLLPINAEEEQEPGYRIPDVIQTDASINPGNSGGVLVDDTGRVIGVTTAILSPVGASVGIGFAIPSVIVQKVVPDLITNGHYDHTWLGVGGQFLTSDLAQAMGLKADQRGALVVDVVPGSPADKAGLHGSGRQTTIEGEAVRIGGDVVVAIDGQPIRSFDDVITYLSRATQVGQTVTLRVLRDGQEHTLPVILAARPRSEAQRDQEEDNTAAEVWLGFQGLTVVPEIAKTMALPLMQRGVLVEQVLQGGPLDQAGVRGSYKPTMLQGQRILVGGDIIVAVGDQPVIQLADLQALVREATPGQPIGLTLLRNRQQVRVMVSLTGPVTPPHD
jgi:serine protease Do